MIVAIETSDVWCSVAFWDEAKKQTLLETNLEIPAQHATLLATVVRQGEEYLQKIVKTHVAFDEAIRLAVVSIGPGSFTGLRIGLSFVQGFCLAKNIPVVGISNHQVLARQMAPCDQKQYTIIDARRDEVYLAKIEQNQDQYPEITEHSIERKDRLPEVIPAGSLLIKPQFHALEADIVRKLRVKGVFIHGQASYPAHILAELGFYKWQAYGADELSSLEPMYIRPFAGVL